MIRTRGIVHELSLPNTWEHDFHAVSSRNGQLCVPLLHPLPDLSASYLCIRFAPCDGFRNLAFPVSEQAGACKQGFAVSGRGAYQDEFLVEVLVGGQN